MNRFAPSSSVAASCVFATKTAFRTATHAVPVVRGHISARPLYVTAARMSRHQAADLIRQMAGRHRLPDTLRRADAVARGRPPGS